MATETALLFVLGLLQALALIILGAVWKEITRLRDWRHDMDGKVGAHDMELVTLGKDVDMIKEHAFRSLGREIVAREHRGNQ